MRLIGKEVGRTNNRARVEREGVDKKKIEERFKVKEDTQRENKVCNIYIYIYW